MKYLKQFFLIIVISFFGELLHWVIPLPIPASIYGIILLFTALVTGLVPLAAVKETGKFLVEIMPVMFIPAAVGLVDSWPLLRESWLPSLLVTFVTTVAVMGVTGLVTQAVIRAGKEKHHD